MCRKYLKQCVGECERKLSGKLKICQCAVKLKICKCAVEVREIIRHERKVFYLKNNVSFFTVRSTPLEISDIISLLKSGKSLGPIIFL